MYNVLGVRGNTNTLMTKIVDRDRFVEVYGSMLNPSFIVSCDDRPDNKIITVSLRNVNGLVVYKYIKHINHKQHPLLICDKLIESVLDEVGLKI